MGRYIKFEDVRIRLVGKVRFTANTEDENKMSETLANRLIAEAEGEVENDLSPRYAAPFVTESDGPFDQIPERPTRNIIRTLCELKSVERILETDFGSGTAVEGSKYFDAVRKRYKEILTKLMARKTVKNQELTGFALPPLPGIKLNYMNNQADDGYAGGIIVSGGLGDGAYPAEQINNPALSWYNGWKDIV